MKPARLFLIFGLGLTLVAQQRSDAPKSGAQKSEGSDPKLAPYFPTPEAIVDRMLQLGGLKPGEKMYDLGSGDGRIVILAARKFKAAAFGVELEESLVKQSTER